MRTGRISDAAAPAVTAPHPASTVAASLRSSRKAAQTPPAAARAPESPIEPSSSARAITSATTSSAPAIATPTPARKTARRRSAASQMAAASAAKASSGRTSARKRTCLPVRARSPVTEPMSRCSSS